MKASVEGCVECVCVRMWHCDVTWLDGQKSG